MNQVRISAGVPTGGQFATAIRDESAVDLAGTTTDAWRDWDNVENVQEGSRAPWGQADTVATYGATTAKIQAEYERLGRARTRVNARIDALDAKMLADKTLARYPDAGTIKLERVSDDCGFHYTPTRVYAADGTLLAEEPDDNGTRWGSDSITSLVGALEEERDTYIDFNEEGEASFDVRRAAAIDLAIAGGGRFGEIL